MPSGQSVRTCPAGSSARIHDTTQKRGLNKERKKPLKSQLNVDTKWLSSCMRRLSPQTKSLLRTRDLHSSPRTQVQVPCLTSFLKGVVLAIFSIHFAVSAACKRYRPQRRCRRTKINVMSFFPRVRTPCGHGAQVIVEGREEQTDGGERNEGPKTNPKPNTQARRPKLHHLLVFPLH